jgi:hypothetical protein
MPSQPINSPQTLDAAIEINKQSRREALLRTARGEGIWLPEALSGLVTLLAVAELFIEPKRAVFAAVIVAISIGSTCMTRMGRQMKAVCTLLEMDRAR